MMDMQPAPLAETPAVAPEPTGPVLKIPLPEDKLALFTKEIERARQLRESKIAEWQVEKNLERYAPAKETAVGVNVGVDFRDVERKGAALFYDTPTVSLQPGPDGHPEAAILHQELLNGLLSAQSLNAKATATKAIKDCLVAIQPAFTVIGYQPTTVDVPLPADPMNPAAPTTAPIVVHDEVFWSRISAKGGLLPVDFRDTDYDRSPWLGYDWKKPKSEVIRWLGLPADWLPNAGAARDTAFNERKDDPAGSSDPPVSGTLLWYRACLFDETVKHPELLRQLVLVDGLEGLAAKHENAPWQELDPTGRLTADSINGYPIHPLALRDFPDSAWVPSDCSQTGPLTQEINDYLTGIKAKRNSNRLLLLADIAKLDPEAIAKIKEMDIFKGMDMNIIPVTAEALASGNINTVMQQVPMLDLGRESYLGLEIMEQKRDQILGISAPQGGVQNDTQRTATEISTVQRNADARFEQERQRALAWWIRGVQKLSAFVVRYGDRCAVDILGEARAAKWAQFKQFPVTAPGAPGPDGKPTQQPVLDPMTQQPRTVNMLGRFTFDIVIDSGKYIDVEGDRRQFLQIYNFLAKSPFINQQTLNAEFCKKFGYDPAQWMAQPQPPRPEPPKMALSFSGEDLAAPQSPMVVEILAQQGIQISPEAVTNVAMGVKVAAMQQAQADANPITDGPADKADRLDQHQMDLTGDRSGPKVN